MLENVNIAIKSTSDILEIASKNTLILLNELGDKRKKYNKKVKNRQALRKKRR